MTAVGCPLPAGHCHSERSEESRCMALVISMPINTSRREDIRLSDDRHQKTVFSNARGTILPPWAVRIAMEHPIGALPRTPFPASRDFPSRGNEKIGGTGYCVTYDTDSQSRNVLASPLGEEGHEVAKGWTRVRMNMILDVDVTAAGGIIKLIAP